MKQNQQLIKPALLCLLICVSLITILKIVLIILLLQQPEAEPFDFPLIIPSALKIVFDLIATALLIMSWIIITRTKYIKNT